MRLSIIVAIYNVGNYLNHCIECILNQSFTDYEILLIDDGSTDSSGNICDGYALKDSRIKVFHKSHQGVAHSRQIGIDNAYGEYFIFIDADDTIKPTMLEDMYITAKNENADIVIADYTELTHNGDIYKRQKPSQLTGLSVMEDIIGGNLYGALWNKLIKTDIVRKNNIRFHEKLSMREDLIFLCNLLPYVAHVSYIPKAFYNYERRNTSSLTNKYLNESVEYYRQEIMWNRALLENKCIPCVSRQRILEYYCHLAYITLHCKMLDATEWHDCFAKYKNAFSRIGTGYKSLFVLLALNGHFSIARRARTLIAKIKGK